MGKSVGTSVIALLRASHFGPTLIVVTTAFFLSLTNFSLLGSFQIAIAILAGQLVVGWTNELIDYPLDSAAARQKKPLVSGIISKEFLQKSLIVAVAFALGLSLLSPLSFYGSAIHFLGILSATLYNFKLKSTRFSVLPYMISFGLMPWAVYLAAGQRPPVWLYLSFILVASAFHFLNVIKDLEWDLSQNVLGLPQRLGRNKSITVAIGLVLLAIAISTYGIFF